MKTFVKEYMEDTTGIYNAPEIKEIMLEASRKNTENDRTNYDPKVIEPFSFMNRDVTFEKAVGDDEIIDMDKMIKNARKNNNREE